MYILHNLESIHVEHLHVGPISLYKEVIQTQPFPQFEEKNGIVVFDWLKVTPSQNRDLRVFLVNVKP